MGENLTKLCSSNHIVQIKKNRAPFVQQQNKHRVPNNILKVLYVLLDGVNNWIGGEGEGEQERDEEPAQIAKKTIFVVELAECGEG